MPSSIGVSRFYVDSRVFLSLIQETPGRVLAIRHIFGQCENLEVELFTSQISIAEVAFAQAEKDGRALDPDVEAKIDNLWDPSFPLQLVEAHQLIVTDAKALIRNAMEVGWRNREQWSLKPNDAIHLVTAKRHNVDAFLTYDRPLRKYAQVMGFEIHQPRGMFADPEPPVRMPLKPSWCRCVAPSVRRRIPLHVAHAMARRAKNIKSPRKTRRKS